MARLLLRNASGSPFSGWLRAHVEWPQHEVSDLFDSYPSAFALGSGEVLVAAEQAGLDVIAFDVRCELAPGELRKLDLSAISTDWQHDEPQLPFDALAFFGLPRLMPSGVPFQLVSAGPTGAAVAVHLRVRAQAWCYDVHLRWYPEQPGCVQGELMVTLSDASRDVLSAPLPFDALLQFGEQGKAFVQFLGLPVGAPALRAGEMFGDGQTRAFPFVVVWPEHLRSAAEFNSAAALAQFAVGGHGVENLYSCGSPRPFDAVAFFRAHWGECVQALHRWTPPSIGVAANSAQAGAQEDQVFVGGECIDEPLGVLPRYLAALAQLRRPCHHLEANGELLRLEEHEDLMLWDSRPLWISRDQLGKSRALTMAESHGWWGGDVEHWLLNTLNVVARLMPSTALRVGLEAQALVYLKQWTVDPALSTSQPYASRAVGWECLAAVQLFRNLRNRVRAGRVLERLVQRLERVILPQHEAKANDVWDVRIDDNRLGPGPRFIAWQQAVEAGLLDIAGEFLIEQGHTAIGERARALALRGALRVLDWSWKLQDTGTGIFNWQSNPSGQSANDGSGGEWGDGFDFFGMSMAPAVVLRQRENATDEQVKKASSIWRELLRNDPRSSWLVPGVTP